MRQVYDIIYQCKMETDINELMVCVNEHFEREMDQNKNEQILAVDDNKIATQKQMEQRFREIQKGLKRGWDSTLNID